MNTIRVKEIFIIGFTLLIGMVLVLLPLPNWAVWARPEWVFLILMFWIMLVPHKVGIGVAWCVGLLLDLLTGTLLGQHAFALSIIAYLVIKINPQLRNFPLMQQTLMVFILVMLNLALQYLIMGLANDQPGTWAYWLPAITTTILWPWVSILLRDYRVRFN